MAVASIPQEFRNTITELSIKIAELASSREAMFIGIGGKLGITTPLDKWRIDLSKWEIETPDPEGAAGEDVVPLGTAPPKKKKE